jgi:hypothetical protein
LTKILDLDSNSAGKRAEKTMMKYFLFSISLLLGTTKSYSQQLGTDKIESKYFENLARFDTCDVVILADDIRLNFIYRDIYLGAVDESFRAELTRQVRIKVNRINSLSREQLIIAKIADSISMDEIKITDLSIYKYKNGKVLKDKVKTKSSGISLVNGIISLNLSTLEISDGAIVNFGYELRDVLKKTQRWNILFPYYAASTSFEVYVPEIYVYRQETVNPNNLAIDYTKKKSEGILIGYYAPHVNLKHKLITSTYYSLMKDKDADVNKATKVYCGYTTHKFGAQNVFPVAVGDSSAYIDFKLVTVNPILY